MTFDVLLCYKLQKSFMDKHADQAALVSVMDSNSLTVAASVEPASQVLRAWHSPLQCQHHSSLRKEDIVFNSLHSLVDLLSRISCAPAAWWRKIASQKQPAATKLEQ